MTLVDVIQRMTSVDVMCRTRQPYTGGFVYRSCALRNGFSRAGLCYPGHGKLPELEMATIGTRFRLDPFCHLQTC